MAQVEDLWISMGTLNVEWEVRPPIRRREAMPEEATQRMIFP